MPDRRGPQVAGLVLAAGRASRFGADKRLAPWPGHGHEGTLLGAVLDTFMSVLSPVLVVLRPGDEPGMRIARASGAIPVICNDADLGMGHSLACGATALQGLKDGGLRGVLIGLADMPSVSPQTLRGLTQALLAHGRPVVPISQVRPGQLGHPRGLPVDALAALSRLQGDQGARHLLDWQVDAMPIEVDDPGIFLDVDTPADLAAVRRST